MTPAPALRGTRPVRFPAVVATVILAVACGPDIPDYDVHPVVAAVVNHHAHLELSGGIERNSALLLTRMWIPYVGAVGRPRASLFVQARLFPDRDVRDEGEIEWRAPLRSVELVSDEPGQLATVMSDLAVVFRGAPREGCMLAPSGVRRSVQYWLAPGDSGGVAVATDWLRQRADAIDGSLWSLWAWAGPFQGSGTFLASFHAAACDDRPMPRADIGEHASAKLVVLDRKFRDSVRASRRGR